MPTVPARSFATQRLEVGQSIKIVNTSGGQVIDTWAFSLPASGFPRYMSMSHTRSTYRRLLPSVQEAFLDNRRSPILTVVEDTSTGRHDVLYAACSPERYLQLHASPDHDSCANNLYNAAKTRKEPSFDKLREFLEYGWMPDPLNLFMNVPVIDGKVPVLDPEGKPGEYITLRAEQECVVVMSACPMDVSTCNGGPPTSAEFEVL